MTASGNAHEDTRKCVEVCEQGLDFRRVKGHRLTKPVRTSIEDQKWFCYHSRALWRIIPRKLKAVEIGQILEVRNGFSTDDLHKAAQEYSFREKAPEENCFSVIFNKRHFLNKTVDFVADNPESKRIFVTALQHLLTKRKAEGFKFDEQRWLINNFHKADVNNSGSLSFEEIWNLLRSLNLQLNKTYAKALFSECDVKGNQTKSGDLLLDKDEFLEFFRRLTERPEISHIINLFGTSSGNALTPSDLHNFLIEEQQFTNVDEKKAEELIEEFEPITEKEAKIKLLGTKGMRRLLNSSWSYLMRPEHNMIFQDMDHPLSHYYINSSHNTYLTGLQMKGDASIEGYISALKMGSRLLELDIFDGEDGEPCITHKRTLIGSITLRRALESIDKYAFERSPFPVILTIENHVSLPQQKAMARIFNEVLGDKIYIRPEDGAVISLPSPNFLKHKYLIRGKKAIGQSVRDKEFDQDDDEKDETKKKQIKLDPDFSRLISLPSVKISSNIFEDIKNHPMDGSASLSESAVEKYFEGGYSLATYTSTRLIKSYPKGLRLDSSNMDPIPSWICGIQCVAMNMQTSGEYQDIVNAMFRTNGNSGYVLKPDALLKGLDPRQEETWKPVTVSVGIISGQYFPKLRKDTDIIDPYVTVEFFGIPRDCEKFRTKTIRNNGFNPTWNETFTKKIHYPDLALLRFCVKDFDSTSSSDFVGEYSIAVSSIRPGYSQIRLYTQQDRRIDDSASLLVRIALE